MEIDIEKLKDRASEIRANLEKIRYYASLKDQDFWADERNIYSVKYLMLEAIEAAGAICIHILAKKFQQPSSSFAECFEALYDHQVIDQDLSEKGDGSIFAFQGNLTKFRIEGRRIYHRDWNLRYHKKGDKI